MTPQTHAYFLVTHGSRRPQSQQSLQKLADQFRAAIIRNGDSTEHPTVATGCLEFQASPLSEQLIQFYQSQPSSLQQIHILPIFLLPGNHVRDDIPDAIQSAQATLQSLALLNTHIHPFVLHPHLGSHPQLETIIQNQMAVYDPEAWIFLGHGSRRPEGNLAIAQLANHLQATPAFWAVQPSLTTQVMALLAQGIRSIGVIPYFLFSGKITEAIAAQVKQLSHQHPELTLQMLSPLSATPQLADALLDLSQSPTLTRALQAKAI